MKKLLAFVAVVAFALSATVASAATYNFTRDLTIGSTGADVVVLQDFLITKGHLVMPAGVSKGYFGSISAAALAKYQASVGISPAAGYFGPITRAHFNAMTDTSTGGGTNPPGQSGDLSGGEGDIKDFDVLSSPNNEDIEEDTEVEIFGFEFEAEDSDLAFERLDFHVEQIGATEIWDVIDEAILYQGDEEVDSIDGLDDEDEWADEDSDIYRLRFSPDTVVKEGDSDKFYVAFVGQGNIDSADLTGADFDVFIPEDGIRVIDAEGIDIYAPSSDSDEKSIGADEQDESAVTVSESDDNPDTGIIVVDDDNDTEDVDVLAFEIESEDSALELDEIRVHATSSSSTVDSLVSEVILEIDGQEFDGDAMRATTTGAYYVFDIDGDVEIDEDDIAEAVVRVTFNKQDGNYAASGETIVFNVLGNATSIQGESVSTGDDLVDGDIDGSVDGNTLTLGLAGIDVEVVEKDSELITPQTGSPYVSHTFVFKVTSLSETVYIPLTAEVSSTTAGFDLDVTAGSGTTTITIDQLTDRTETENSVKLSSGQSAEFEVVVTFNPSSDQSYRAELDNVHFSETAGDFETTYVAPDESEFKSSNTFVPGN
jgi:peptidoglycan hydrolase-like protein with peptidoglycan-binding domain